MTSVTRWRRRTKRTMNHKSNTWYCCVWNCCRRRELSFCESSCFPLYVWKWENQSFTLKYTVLSSGKMSTLHSSYFPQLTFTASKRREMALNQMEQLHLKWQVPLLKDPALLSHLLSVVKLHVWIKEKLQNPFTGFDICFCHLWADYFGFAVLFTKTVQYPYFTDKSVSETQT